MFVETKGRSYRKRGVILATSRNFPEKVGKINFILAFLELILLYFIYQINGNKFAVA